MTLTRNNTVAEWSAAAQDEGFPETPGCEFYAWASGRESAPMATLADAPREVILLACMTALRMTACADRAWFVALVDLHSDSAAVKRWARHG